jgi:hypothetical protein
MAAKLRRARMVRAMVRLVRVVHGGLDSVDKVDLPLSQIG